MDKRWIIIFVIFLLGMSGLYFTANESYKIGDAISIIDNVIITLPQNFKIADKTPDQLTICDRSSDDTISVKLIKDYKDAYNLMKTDMSKNDENSDFKVSDIKVFEIKDKTTGNSTYYFNKFNKTFIIKSENYNNVDKENSDVNYIIDSIRIDFKVKEK